MNTKICKCKVCAAFKTQKVKVFCVVWGGSVNKDYVDYYFLSVNKTKKQFESALKKASQKIIEIQPVSSKCFGILRDVLSDAGFIGLDDLSCCATVYVDVESPEIPGATIDLY